MTDSETIIQFVVLPVLVGFFASVIGFMSMWLSEHFRSMNKNKTEQKKKAEKVRQTVLDRCDKVFNIMKHEAWYAAWRRALPPKDYTDELAEEDKQAWKSYTDAQREWRTTSACNETDICQYFGDGLEHRLFKEIDSLFESVSLELWNVYHAHKEGDVVLSKPGGFDSLAEKRERDLNEEDRIKSRNVFDAYYEELKQKIFALSAVTGASQKYGYVGNLQGNRPPPEGVQKVMNELEGKTGGLTASA
mmetsp:Transcript_21712/g.43919  ORF Transcript_21712/g.43919 Transcript_21712/m.43919 type:complete len:247 (-) Transcript_21712:234-974(-)|eukprot:CAMPEP_0183293622 /NCGR_PEP_ID=MMETSP0160_2-20130417/2238_1 /TAXON_ID=2839 ORGANISM="Odontella Sinensis, Strain Grunow 1884" /NCGR_SAMPLE_ID=MMETSP0160_2 /ASSEMBLY_ACC=CAM_ASM_000250 /LENGTH=246 /DNA_ID=CAMNT_0025454767 /DNA_START=48 /DNA_END=788 /DNA_ORIENTATION=+